MLDLADPAAAAACEALRRRGYCLGGVLPLWFGTDAILMQRPGREPAFDDIALATAQGRDLLAIVKADWESIQG